jgi:hypothetical protein
MKGFDQLIKLKKSSRRIKVSLRINKWKVSRL